MKESCCCPQCGAEMRVHKNPVPTVDVVVVRSEQEVLLVRRRFEPLGWALPGGFVDYGETVEAAAVREAGEETGLSVQLRDLLGVYSDPARDTRQHTITTVFVAEALDAARPQAGDDAAEAAWFPLTSLPELVFDHALILADFIRKHGTSNPRAR